MPATFADRFKYRPVSDQLGYNDYDLADAATIKELAYKAYIVAGDTVYDGKKGIIVEAWLPETLATDIAANYESPLAQGLNGMMPGLGALARFAGVNLTTQALTTQVWQGGGHIQFSIPLIFQAETSASSEVMEPIKQLFALTLPKDPSGGGLLQAPGPHLDFEALIENGIDEAWELTKDLVTDGAKTIANQGLKGFRAVRNRMTNTQSRPVSTNSSGRDEYKTSGNNPAKALSKTIVSSVKNNISLYLGQFLYFPSVVIRDVNPTYDIVLADDKNPMRATVNINFETFYIPTDRDIQNMFPATAANRNRAR